MHRLRRGYGNNTKESKIMKLQGNTALVTGSAAGLGLAIAKKLASEGAAVFLNDIDTGKLGAALKDLSGMYKNVYAYACDITDKQAVSGMFEYLFSKTSKIDILVNNAGITSDSFFHKMDDNVFDRVMKVNLYGTYYCTRFAIEEMRKNSYGRIINISSVVGIAGNIGQVNYSASKAAIIGFTKSLALESAAKNITVNAVAPGFIKSDMTAKIPPEITNKILLKIPMARFGEPDDIAGMVCYLASPEAGYITGQVISVNGGYLM
jgi:3-oxoacyl-(acyl-carrier-protein) reductase